MTKKLKENSNLKGECKYIRSNGMKFDPIESPIIDINHHCHMFNKKATPKQDPTLTHRTYFDLTSKTKPKIEI